MNITNTLNMILEHIYQGKNNGLCNLLINENKTIKKMSFKNTNFIFPLNLIQTRFYSPNFAPRIPRLQKTLNFQIGNVKHLGGFTLALSHISNSPWECVWAMSSLGLLPNPFSMSCYNSHFKPRLRL